MSGPLSPGPQPAGEPGGDLPSAPGRTTDAVPAAPVEPVSVEGPPVEAPQDGPGEDPAPAASPPGGGAAAARPRRRRDPLAASLIGVLTLLLGFAFAVQVRSTDTAEQLAGAREEDLVRILDDVTAQEDRLRQEIADQRVALDSLGDSDTVAAAALQEAQQRAETLGILNGTVAARGPGLELTIRDPLGQVDVDVVLNAIQELRGAGAETMQIDGVRIGVSSAVTGTAGQLAVDGQPLEAPYTVRVIGSPQDMATALNIPGGVATRVSTAEGSLDVVQSTDVVVDALRPLDEPQYAEPAD
ncbi:DUF881 domain-containing protein [Modestobacter muralis]|uniref:DUF881 domain-containing protein n=1 Tax=Modestobacter muralis TaxID=1608614 RepID=A0A6P0HA00_9ACTN|nr:DUF881 domain-containing protein [Modestobacter muralis]NEK95367.1 DUF881 domain-containing protein [Modestobacter muralis]NEN52255.1 DUF881 domain-containing protein [Modestobacter muralis]